MNRRSVNALGLASLLASTALGTGAARAEGGVLTIGRRDDSTTFDPIKTAQNVDFWVFMNVHDVLGARRSDRYQTGAWPRGELGGSRPTR